MNREILFRGKRMDNGEWVEAGTIISTNDADPICWIPVRGEKFLVEEDAHGNILSMEPKTALYRVDPATVGQYTGLTDMNDKRIFEGDVLRLDDELNELWVVSFGNCGGVQNVGHEVGYMGFHLAPLSAEAIKARNYGKRDDLVYYFNAYDPCIIGNIHDNPELLKGGEDG